MIASLCVFAFASLPSDLKPLPEERKLAGAEEIALELARLEAPEVGIIGWTKTAIQRAQLEGTTHYVVHQTAEVLDFKAMGLVAMESRGLYNADLRLVHELRLKEPLGETAKPLELEWGDEGFRWREGRGKWTSVSTEVRPTVKTDVALLIHGLDLRVPFEAQVFEEATKTLEARTLKRGKEKEVDGQTMVDFEVEGPVPMRHRVTTKSVYMESKVGDLGVIGVDVSEDAELGLRRLVADNETFELALATAFPKQWIEKRGTMEHPTLGIRLKLPKGWERATDKEVGTVVLRAFSPDGNAYVNLSVVVQGTGYTLEGWKDGLIEYYAESALEGKVTAEETSFAKQDAIRFEFTSDGASLETTSYAWSRNGIGFALIAGTWVGAPKKLHRETKSVFKSVKL